MRECELCDNYNDCVHAMNKKHHKSCGDWKGWHMVKEEPAPEGIPLYVVRDDFETVVESIVICKDITYAYGRIVAWREKEPKPNFPTELYRGGLQID